MFLNYSVIKHQTEVSSVCPHASTQEKQTDDILKANYFSIKNEINAIQMSLTETRNYY